MALKDKIVNAAVDVFSKQGYHKASMDEIARTAGVAKGSLYYHYKGKGDLFVHVIKEGVAELNKNMDEIALKDESTDKLLMEILDLNINFYLHYPGLSRIFFKEMTNGLDDDVLLKVREIKLSMFNKLKNLMEEGCKWGMVKTVNFDIAAAGIFGMLDGACEAYIDNDDIVDVEEVREFMYTALFHGLMK